MIKNQRKILILMPLATQRGGAEKLFLQYVTQNPFKQLFVVVFFEHGSMVNSVKNTGIPTYVVLSGRLANPLKYFKTISVLVKIIKKFNVKTVFSFMNKAHFYGFLAAKLTACSAIWYQHNKPSNKFPYDYILNKLPCSKILTCSKANKSIQQKFSNKPIKVVYPGIDFKELSLKNVDINKEKKLLNLPINTPLIMFFGRLQYWKGVHVFIRAAKMIIEKQKAMFYIVGSPHKLELDYYQYLKKLIKQEKLNKLIRIVGHKTNVSQWMQCADVVVHASDYEPFGLVVVESTALAKPTIAGALGGPAEIIKTNQTGILINYGDYAKIAQTIIKLFDNPKFSKKISLAGYKRAQIFTLNKFINKLNQNIR